MSFFDRKPVANLAYEARKAPGGAYHHNIFHQSEHLVCMFRLMHHHQEVPQTILFPYTITPWARSLVGLLLPQTHLVSTCCKEKVAALWWTGQRRVCGCWQRVCPGPADSIPDPLSFWPGAAGREAHLTFRRVVRMRCRALAPRPLWRGASERTVKLVTRPSWAGRKLEDEAQLLGLLLRRGVRDARNVVAETKTEDVTNYNRSAAWFCDQVYWYAHAQVVVSVHGSQLTNALFADSGAVVIDIQPYAYRPEAAAPRDYYAALLDNTDVTYTPVASARPSVLPRLKGDPVRAVSFIDGGGSSEHAHNSTDVLNPQDLENRERSSRCARDKRCRLAYRDGANVLLGSAGRERVSQLVIQALGRSVMKT